MTDFQMLTSPREEGPNMEERDYYGLNSHLEVDFEDIVAEPDTDHSLGCVWANSFKCFDLCLAVSYTFHTLCCGICSAFVVGYEVGASFFLHVWCCTPVLKAMRFYCLCPKTMCLKCVLSTVRPCCEHAVDQFTSYKRHGRPPTPKPAPAKAKPTETTTAAAVAAHAATSAVAAAALAAATTAAPTAAAAAATAKDAEEGAVANGVSVDNKTLPPV